jgi:hypothetical protein
MPIISRKEVLIVQDLPLVRLWVPLRYPTRGQLAGKVDLVGYGVQEQRHGGGTCFGDSGEPDLLGGTDTVLAVNSYVTNSNCSGVGYSSRVDIPEVLSWINGYLNP